MHVDIQLSRKISCVLLASICLVFFYTGCEPAFDPIKQNDRYFSVFGYLDASADTQYVRIEKLRDGMPSGTPEDLDVEVTLTNMDTGRSESLQDAIFNYYQQGKAHNFYTTMEIKPAQKYRLEVQGDEGSSSAEVEIPSAFPKPEVVTNSKYETALLLPDIERLVAVKTIYQTCRSCYCDKPIRFTYQHLQDTLHFEDGSVKAKIDLNEEKKEIYQNYPEGKDYAILRYDVVVAAGMPSWPDFTDLDPEAVALPDVATNIKHGTGFLGGIVTDTLNMRDQCTMVQTKTFSQ